MQIKYIKVETARLIERCRLQDRQAQKMLYENYAPQMLGLCRRYFTNIQEAEDALMRGFVKVFRQIDKLQDDTKFEYWMRRIMANECLMILRKKKKMVTTELSENSVAPMPPTVLDTLSTDDILSLIDNLPEGYRTIFNMYVIEGFKHKEIAEHLKISVNTSKSQLIMARRKLQQAISILNNATNFKKANNT